MEEDMNILKNMLNTTKTNRRGNREIRFEVNSNYYKAIENLINRNKELEKLELEHQKINGELRETVKEIEEDYTSVYLKGIYDERDKWKSKIKEKIEELKRI